MEPAWGADGQWPWADGSLGSWPLAGGLFSGLATPSLLGLSAGAEAVGVEVKAEAPQPQPQPQPLLCQELQALPPLALGLPPLRMPLAVSNVNPYAEGPATSIHAAARDISSVHASCRCRKSRCLKKYCDCFARGAACTEKCSCLECGNATSTACAVEATFCNCTETQRGNGACSKKYCVCRQAGRACGPMCHKHMRAGVCCNVAT